MFERPPSEHFNTEKQNITKNGFCCSQKIDSLKNDNATQTQDIPFYQFLFNTQIINLYLFLVE